jgi:hypothetical protein
MKKVLIKKLRRTAQLYIEEMEEWKFLDFSQYYIKTCRSRGSFIPHANTIGIFLTWID